MNHVKPPLLSIVIPTFKRPQYLARAIKSIIDNMPLTEIEILVIPNGPDTSWKDGLENFSHHTFVKTLPIATPHANAARNHGKNNATGKYIRFLDDDDFLYEDAWHQILLLESSDADICSGLIRNIDENGDFLGMLKHPNTLDFVVASIAHTGFCLPIGNVFLRQSIANCTWNEKVNRGQDQIWMLDLATHKEWNWIHLEKPVGAWFHHRNQRISINSKSNHDIDLRINAFKNLRKHLQNNNRLSGEREHALLDIFFYYAHSYFPYFPIKCTKILRYLNDIEKVNIPFPFFIKNKSTSINIVLIAEWIFFPLRVITTRIKDLQRSIIDSDHQRYL